MARLLGPIWRHPGLTIMQKVMASLHLGQYLVHPVIVVLLLITPPLLVLDGLRELPLGPLGIAGLGPPLVFIVSQRALYPDWQRRLLALPVLIALGTGLALNNARAVISGLLGQAEEFKRTPKFAGQSQVASLKNAYIIKLNSAFIWEFALSVYSLVGMLLALRFAPALAPYLGIYAFAFGGVALWGLRDYLDTRRTLAIRPA
jgi:hypothetical protein